MFPFAFLLLLAMRWPEAVPPPAIEDFHSQVLRRFTDGRGFGMSRIVMWPTLGHHFRAPAGAKVDFQPENAEERTIIESWTRDGWQSGIFVFGRAIETEAMEAKFHRALKGPGVLNANTVRGELPAWAEVYPVAAEAMKRFELGAMAYSANVDGWTLHARPVMATSEACGKCHKAEPAVKAGDVLGGVVYLFRR